MSVRRPMLIEHNTKIFLIECFVVGSLKTTKKKRSIGRFDTMNKGDDVSPKFSRIFKPSLNAKDEEVNE